MSPIGRRTPRYCDPSYIDLARKGRTPEELARQFEPSAQALRNWVRQADLDAEALSFMVRS